MMINKRLIGTVSESKRYIAGNVAAQWCSLGANIAMMAAITRLLERPRGGMSLLWGQRRPVPFWCAFSAQRSPAG